jgi:hypothetical protein
MHEGSKTLFSSKTKVREEEEILVRYQYANSVLSFLKCFIEKYAYIYVLCFLGSINDNLGADSQSPIEQYFKIYLLYEGTHLINPVNKLPDKMVSINFKISPSAKLAEIKQEIEGFMEILAGNNGALIPTLRQKISKEIQKLQ